MQLITFDCHGISGHINHIHTYRGACLAAEKQCPADGMFLLVRGFFGVDSNWKGKYITKFVMSPLLSRKHQECWSNFWESLQFLLFYLIVLSTEKKDSFRI